MGGLLPIHHVDRIRIGDFPEKEESGSHAYKHDKHREALEPQRQMGVEVERKSHEEGTGEDSDARDLPVKLVLVEPEGAPALESKSHPLDL